MNFLKYAACAAMLLPLNCFASSQIDLQEFNCTGLQSTDSVNNLTINCDGDLTLKGGTISANGDIILKASGRIMLDNITIDTPSTITFDAAIGGEITATVAFNASGFVHPGKGLGGLRIGNDLIGPPFLRPIDIGSVNLHLKPIESQSVNLQTLLISPMEGLVTLDNGLISMGPGSKMLFSEPGIITGSITGHVVLTTVAPIERANGGPGNMAGGSITIISSGIISGGNHGGVHPQPAPCTESTFRIKQTGKRYCSTGESNIKEDAFLRVVGECSGNPSQFQVSASQDFPDDASTVSIKANCNDSGKLNFACLLHSPTTSDGVLSMPTAFTGLLKLTRRPNGQILNLHGDILQQTADNCSSQIHLKSLSRL